MTIWKKQITPAELDYLCKNSAVSHLGIQFQAINENEVIACLILDHRTCQPMGLLHGGISAALAETLGSAGAFLSCGENQIPVGTELNISHFKAIKQGIVTGKATPLHLGKSSQVWQIDIYNETEERCASARLAVRLLDQ